MKNAYFENSGTSTFLVYELSEQETLDTMSLGMITNNRIPGLAQTVFTQMDNKKYIKFNVSAKVSVSQFFAGAVNKKRLLGVFMGIVDAMLAAEEYMLDPTSILLDLDYIFTDVSTCETDLLCVPVVGEGSELTDLGVFFKNIMYNTQFDQTENCDHIAKIINYLNSTPMFTLEEFKKVLETLQNQRVQPVVSKVNTAAAGTPQNTGKQPEVKQVQKPVQQPPVQQRPVQQPPVQGIARPTHSAGQPVQPPVSQPAQPPVPPKAPGGYAVPGGMNVPPAKGGKPQQTQAAPQTGEKEISWFYLMQHYNKENAEAYKAQKEAKKNKGKAPKTQGGPVPGPGVTPPSAPGVSFAIPGQPTPPPQPVPQPRPVAAPPAQPAPQPRPTGQPAPQPQPAFVPREVPMGGSMNFGETTVLGGGATGETTVLTAAQGAAQQVLPFLIREKNSEKVTLNKPVFRIGKERSYVDYFIGDNTAISRSHANIISRDGAYYVVDTNSTNHTYVNGAMIQSGHETPITHGDKLRLANEEFTFQLY